MNQALFAWNRVYCLNEKRAVRRAAALPASLPDYERRVGQAFALLGESPARSAAIFSGLAEELEALCRQP